MAAKFESTNQYSTAYSLLFSACEQAVAKSGFSVHNSVIDIGYIEARVSISLLSTGEKIAIQVKRDGNVTVTSQSITQLIDYGKNKGNVLKFFSNLEHHLLLLANDVTVVNKSGDSNPSSVSLKPHNLILSEIPIEKKVVHDEEKDEHIRLIYLHNRRLQKLREQVALYGISVDPRILMEIEDIEKQIAQLQHLLDLDQANNQS
jgi:hypothetical protein